MPVKAYNNVDEYLAHQSKEAAATLQNLRSSIKKLYPKPEEYISYQVPTFKYKGKSLVSYAGFKKHCGFYLNSMDTANRLRPELKNVVLKGVTIQFGFNETLPQTLLKKIIKARMQDVDALIEAKKPKK
jgi:uncharacterized protein YdhG (YjbR/CyaY superfamily)